jgi:hypothetical protein
MAWVSDRQVSVMSKEPEEDIPSPTALSFIYIIVILVYSFKRKQDGSFMHPLTIFGIIQAIMITVMRLYLFISFKQLFGVSILFEALFGVTQTIIQFILLRKDLAL